MTVAYACGRLFVCMREFQDEILLGGENCETREKRIIIFFLKMSESIILVGTVQTKP